MFLKFIFRCLFQFSHKTYVRWSKLILLIFVGFWSLVSSQWHFEKGYWVKTRCRISLIYAVGKDGFGAWGKDRYWCLVNHLTNDHSEYRAVPVLTGSGSGNFAGGELQQNYHHQSNITKLRSFLGCISPQTTHFFYQLSILCWFRSLWCPSTNLSRTRLTVTGVYSEWLFVRMVNSPKGHLVRRVNSPKGH